MDFVTPGFDCSSRRIAVRQMLVSCLCLGSVACLTGFLVCIASVFVFTAANPPGTSRTQPSASHFRVNEIPSSPSLHLPLCTWEPEWSPGLGLDYRGIVVRFVERQFIYFSASLNYLVSLWGSLGPLFRGYQGFFTLG